MDGENRGGMETIFHNVRAVELRCGWRSRSVQSLFKDDGGIDQRTWTRAAEEEEARIAWRFTRLPRTISRRSSKSCASRHPASIYFIFSRRGCREALQRCSYHDLDLTTAAEKEASTGVAAERLLGSRM